MKKLQFLLFFIPFLAISQETTINVQKSSLEPLRTTLHIQQEGFILVKDFFRKFESNFGLHSNHEMRQTKKLIENSQLAHYKFKQYYKNLEVYGADYFLHEKNEKLVSGNGLIFPIDELNVNPAITEDKLGELCSNVLHINTESFDFHNQQLVIINKNYPFSDGEMILAYVNEVHIHHPVVDHRKIIINAQTGEVIRNFTIQTNCFKDKVKVETLYHDERDVDAEKEGSEYVSKDLSRGGGIFVTNKAGKLYSNSENQWVAGSDNYKNGMHDLFWGLQKTYDYFKQKLNRDGADNKMLPIKAFLLDTESYVNAFWSPTLHTLNFGIGDGNNYSPLTSIDVVGHEFAHGVTQFSAGLEYLYEAGALNESFSDIFGKAIEYEYDRNKFDWYIGGRFAKTKAQSFRNMENPNAFQCPKYYKGIQWKTGSGDNGGVHFNSGVLNYWYYLLCTGKDTINEAKVNFSVKKLGIDSATLFAYTLLNNYLGKTSGYYDAREASLLLASNWWGACSPEYHNISEAWKAVGVGSNAIDNDLQLINTNALVSSCKDGGYFIASRINNQSCSKDIPIGSEIIMYYKLDTFPVYKETLNLSKEIIAGSHLDFNFSVNPKIVKNGQSRLTVWMESGIDSDTSNNRYSFLINRITTQTEHDFRINNFNVIGAPCPNNGNMYTANSSSTYNGCNVIPPGNELQLLFKFSDSSYTHKFINQTSIYPQGFISINDIPIPRSFLGLKKVNVSLIWPKDTLINNNTLASQIVMINSRVLNELETFESAKYDSIKLAVNSDSFNTSRIYQVPTFDNDALVITGGKILNPNGTLIIRNDADMNQMFNRNTKFTTKLYICADVSQISSPKLEFDLAQKIGSFNYDSLNLSVPLSPASTRIRFYNSRNEIQDEVLIFEALDALEKNHHAYNIPPSTNYIDITNLCMNGSVDASGNMNPDGDFIVFDNIVITGSTLVSDIPSTQNIIAYPNPSAGKIALRCLDSGDYIEEYSLVNSLGENIESKRNLQENGQIELLAQRGGVYCVKVKTKSGKQSSLKLVFTH
ncbi:MAG: T9SS type A sorting domain-containing protein [Saprospiraceae bacterium]|nr:T9SS type A sorting domain-containing protein [Saprospiraceae bacterium]